MLQSPLPQSKSVGTTGVLSQTQQPPLQGITSSLQLIVMPCWSSCGHNRDVAAMLGSTVNESQGQHPLDGKPLSGDRLSGQMQLQKALIKHYEIQSSRLPQAIMSSVLLACLIWQYPQANSTMPSSSPGQAQMGRVPARQRRIHSKQPQVSFAAYAGSEGAAVQIALPLKTPRHVQSVGC